MLEGLSGGLPGCQEACREGCQVVRMPKRPDPRDIRQLCNPTVGRAPLSRRCHETTAPFSAGDTWASSSPFEEVAFICPSGYLSIDLSVYLFINLSIYLLPRGPSPT